MQQERKVQLKVTKVSRVHWKWLFKWICIRYNDCFVCSHWLNIFCCAYFKRNINSCYCMKIVCSFDAKIIVMYVKKRLEITFWPSNGTCIYFIHWNFSRFAFKALEFGSAWKYFPEQLHINSGGVCDIFKEGENKIKYSDYVCISFSSSVDG